MGKEARVRIIGSFSCAMALLVVLAVWRFAAGDAAAQEVVAVPGTQVSMPAPNGFVLSQRFAGFEDTSTGASIVVVEMPADAFGELAQGLTAEALAQRGITQSGREDMTHGGLPTVMISGTQVAGNLSFEKRLFILGGNITALLTATVPQGHATAPRLAEIEAALQAARLSGVVTDGREQLPFSFDEVAGFRFERTLAGSAALLVEEEPSQTSGRPAIFIIANSLNQDCPQFTGQEESFGRQLLGQLRDFTVAEVLSSRDVSVNGVPGIEHIAEGSSNDGEAITVVQTVLFEECNYLRSIGLAPRAEGQAYVPRFRALAEAVQSK